jgi:hypothetical protein
MAVDSAAKARVFARAARDWLLEAAVDFGEWSADFGEWNSAESIRSLAEELWRLGSQWHFAESRLSPVALWKKQEQRKPPDSRNA